MMKLYFAWQAVILMLPFMLMGYLAGIVVLGFQLGYKALVDIWDLR